MRYEFQYAAQISHLHLLNQSKLAYLRQLMAYGAIVALHMRVLLRIGLIGIDFVRPTKVGLGLRQTKSAETLSSRP